MRFRKAFAGVLTGTILSLSTVAAFAMDTEAKFPDIPRPVIEIIPISSELNTEQASHFNSFTGVVTKITDYRGIEGAKFVSLENEEGVPANIIIADDTYLVNDGEIAEGSEITAFYEANVPMIMIYPPQYKAKVVVIGNQEQNIKVDVFDKELVSSDNHLKLNVSEKTEIAWQDGRAFEGELAAKKLIVFYGIATKSIPAQTSPNKIIVLTEKEVETPEPSLEKRKISDVNVSDGDMVVNNKIIEAPAAYTDERGTVMVPLRAIAKALDFEVGWNKELQSITLGNDVSLTIGEDNYVTGKSAAIKLGTAPALKEGKSFVPLSFFEKVAGVNNISVSGTQIITNNVE